MRRYSLAFLLCLIPATVQAEEPAAQWILVTASVFRAAVGPLCEHRKAEGLHVVVVQTSEVLAEDEIRTGEAGKLRD